MNNQWSRLTLPVILYALVVVTLFLWGIRFLRNELKEEEKVIRFCQPACERVSPKGMKVYHIHPIENGCECLYYIEVNR